MEVKPISPKGLIEARKKPEFFPPEIIEAFNDLITEKFDGKQSRVYQNEVEKLAISKMNKNGKKIKAEEIYKKGWMDVEPLFRAGGWIVEFDKPGYNESYEAFFLFTPKRKSR